MAGFIQRGGETEAYATKIAADRSYGADNETSEVRNDSLRACNARTLERLNDLHVNTMQLVDIIAQLGGSGDGPSNISTGRGGLDQKEPPEPSAPVFQARRIEQRVEQQIDMQRNLIGKLRSLIG